MEKTFVFAWLAFFLTFDVFSQDEGYQMTKSKETELKKLAFSKEKFEKGKRYVGLAIHAPANYLTEYKENLYAASLSYTHFVWKNLALEGSMAYAKSMDWGNEGQNSGVPQSPAPIGGHTVLGGLARYHFPTPCRGSLFLQTGYSLGWLFDEGKSIHRFQPLGGGVNVFLTNRLMFETSGSLTSDGYHRKNFLMFVSGIKYKL